MTALVFDLRTRARIAPAPRVVAPTTTVPCPPWCPGNCVGGETFVFDDGHPGVTTSRLHERRIFHTRAADDIGGAPVGVMVTLERCDEPDRPGPTEVVLKVGAEGVRLTRQQRADLAAVLLAADDPDGEVTQWPTDAPSPTTTAARSPSCTPRV